MTLPTSAAAHRHSNDADAPVSKINWAMPRCYVWSLVFLSRTDSQSGVPLLDAASAIEKVVLASPVVWLRRDASARVNARKNWWEWVFVTTVAVLHVIKPSRGKAVVTALFASRSAEVWVSRRYARRPGHGVEWQVCLAHLLRDAMPD